MPYTPIRHRGVVAAGADHVERMWLEMSDKPTGVAAAHAAAWDIARQLEYAADTCLYGPAAALMRNAKDEIERRRWIPVTERLPANRQRVIAFFPSEIESVGEATFRNDEENRWLTEHGSWFDVTHWMPLPAPPTDDK